MSKLCSKHRRDYVWAQGNVQNVIHGGNKSNSICCVQWEGTVALVRHKPREEIGGITESQLIYY